MKSIVLFFALGLSIVVLTANGCAIASPRVFDVNKESPNLEAGQGIIIGKLESLGYGGAAVDWWPFWKKLTGVAVSLSISLDGVDSNYGITSSGFYAIRHAAGSVTNLQFKFSEGGSTAGSAGSGDVSVGVGSTFRQDVRVTLASTAKPITVTAGKLTVIPVRSITFKLKGGFKEPTVDSGARNAEIIDWFKKTYPGPAASYTVAR